MYIILPKRNKAILTRIIENIVHVLHHENVNNLVQRICARQNKV